MPCPSARQTHPSSGHKLHHDSSFFLGITNPPPFWLLTSIPFYRSTSLHTPLRILWTDTLIRVGSHTYKFLHHPDHCWEKSVLEKHSSLPKYTHNLFLVCANIWLHSIIILISVLFSFLPLRLNRENTDTNTERQRQRRDRKRETERVISKKPTAKGNRFSPQWKQMFWL